MKLTTDQQRALKVMRSGVNVFLSGASGTGKSFLIKQFMEENKNKNIIICAPKGMAAAGAGDDTLHSVFAIPKGILKVGDYNSQPEKAVMDADIVIIDDISMCRIDVFEYVVRTLLNIRKNLKLEGDMDHYEKQIILSGDFYRMPPVINREDKHDFLANSLISRGIPTKYQRGNHMYLDAVVRVPEAPGKITFHAKGRTTYVEYECERVYMNYPV